MQLTVLDPGHFHAALLQKKDYPDVEPTVHVYAPAGPDLDDYTAKIAGPMAVSANPFFPWRLQALRPEPYRRLATFLSAMTDKSHRLWRLPELLRPVWLRWSHSKPFATSSQEADVQWQCERPIE